MKNPHQSILTAVTGIALTSAASQAGVVSCDRLGRFYQ